MGKLMPLELLSSIKGAKPSPAVNELFTIIKGASLVMDHIDHEDDHYDKHVSIEDLRNDEVIESLPEERQIIKDNFPVEKNGMLVVSKVIEGL